MVERIETKLGRTAKKQQLIVNIGIDLLLSLTKNSNKEKAEKASAYQSELHALTRELQHIKRQLSAAREVCLQSAMGVF